MRFNVFLPRSTWRFLGPTLVFTASVGLHGERTATELRHPDTLRVRLPRSTDLPVPIRPPSSRTRARDRQVTTEFDGSRSQ
jgi:hypothetical protein